MEFNTHTHQKLTNGSFGLTYRNDLSEISSNKLQDLSYSSLTVICSAMARSNGLLDYIGQYLRACCVAMFCEISPFN